MMKVIDKRIEVPHQLRDHRDMLFDYLGEFRDDQTGRVHYRALANDLQSFNFDKETNLGVLPKSALSISSGKYSIAGVEPKKNIFNSEYTVGDTTRIPQNKLEDVEKRVVKMNRVLRDKFQSQDALEKCLRDKAGADKNGNLE
jgi:hypothetical protein